MIPLVSYTSKNDVPREMGLSRFNFFLLARCQQFDQAFFNFQVRNKKNISLIE